MDTWSLQDAKARFSEVVDRALTDGPQVVTRRGENTVVIISYENFKAEHQPTDLKTFLLSLRGTWDLPITGERHAARKLDFEVPT
ncbi:MAG TPA: type II toxin-antitoxin system Phd/YefM family antitoxin [Stellaceae bacterium]|nr:type II toxin-antitoxin system Phd/YefM family antitoxin [Stellaceae bacterium]